MLPMTLDPTQLPDDIATLKAMVIAAERKASDRGLEIEALKLTLGKSFEGDQFQRLEQKGLFVKRISSDQGGTLTFYKPDYEQMLLNWASGDLFGLTQDRSPAICRASASCMRHHPAVPAAAGA